MVQSTVLATSNDTIKTTKSHIKKLFLFTIYIYCLTLCWGFSEVKGSSRFQIIILLKFSIEVLQDWIVDASYCLTLQDRIVEMTLDKEYDVAVQAIKLVINILKWVDLFFFHYQINSLHLSSTGIVKNTAFVFWLREDS